MKLSRNVAQLDKWRFCLDFSRKSYRNSNGEYLAISRGAIFSSGKEIKIQRILSLLSGSGQILPAPDAKDNL